MRTKIIIFKKTKKILKVYFLIILLFSVEHIILIENYKQLKSQINNYKFQYNNLKSAKFLSNISLFK